MRKVLLAGLGVALILIGSCSAKSDEAMAEESYSEASSAKAKVVELDQRIQEVESRLGV